MLLKLNFSIPNVSIHPLLTVTAYVRKEGGGSSSRPEFIDLFLFKVGIANLSHTLPM